MKSTFRMTVRVAALAFGVFSVWYSGSAASARAQDSRQVTSRASCWQVYYPPGPVSFSILVGVAASAANDVWAFGAVEGSGVELERFDGTQWTSFPTHHLPKGSSWWDIRSRGPGDVWAVAQTRSGPYVAHWDGKAWSVVPSPTVDGQLLGVAPLSDGSVWAAGNQSDGSPLMEELDRKTGQFQIDTHIFNPSTASSFQAIAGVASDSLFAGGLMESPTTALLEQHVAGTPTWVNVSGQPSPDFVSSIAARSRSDAWVVGPCCGATDMAPFVEHWNGATWNLVPPPQSGTVWLQHVDAPEHSRYTWVAGLNYDTGSTFVERYDGMRWQNLALPNAEIFAGSINSLTSVPGSHDEWAVGYYRPSPSVVQNVALRWSC
jgi:hypothetical protein